MPDKRTIGDDVVVVNVDVSPVIASRARHITTCCRGRCTTELHRFFDALANTSDTNDPRPTADLKVRGCVKDTECCPNWIEDAEEGELNTRATPNLDTAKEISTQRTESRVSRDRHSY